MRKCLKCIFLPALMALVLAIGACASPAPAPDDTTVPPIVDANGIPIFLITDYGGIDDGSFNQGSWEGVVAFAQARGIPHEFIQPSEVSDAEYLNAIELAVASGAQIVVTPGFLFASALYTAQDMFPDTNFILLDTEPAPDRDSPTRVGQNVVSIFYAEEQSGFLAGYAAVMEGYRNLGFMGGLPVPPVIRFGHGFVEGANYAAETLGLEPGEVSINYTYVMTFSTSPEVVVEAASWFAAGTEIIFAGAGAAGFSVFSAAESAGASTIGVDTDQSWASPTVVTSALKELSVSVYDMLDAHFNGTFPGGTILNYDAAINGVGLPMATSRFDNFTQEQYEEIFNRLVSGEIVVSTVIPDTAQVADANLNADLVTVNQM